MVLVDGAFQAAILLFKHLSNIQASYSFIEWLNHSMIVVVVARHNDASTRLGFEQFNLSIQTAENHLKRYKTEDKTFSLNSNERDKDQASLSELNISI